MTTAIVLALLALFDAMLGGFRAAAGRDGRIVKGPYYRAALVRTVIAAVVLIMVNAAIVAALVTTAPDPAATWHQLVCAGDRGVLVFGGFATLTLISLGFWFAPGEELRIIPTLVVLGPLTMIRPLVIVGGLTYAAMATSEPRVWIAAAIAGLSMLGFEHGLGRRYARRWRRLL